MRHKNTLGFTVNPIARQERARNLILKLEAKLNNQEFTGELKT
jgi:hypothetical protein